MNAPTRNLGQAVRVFLHASRHRHRFDDRSPAGDPSALVIARQATTSPGCGPVLSRADDPHARNGSYPQLTPRNLVDPFVSLLPCRSTVLVVGDATGDTSALVDILTGTGLEVLRAECSRRMLPQISPSQADLVLLDMVMPSSAGFEMFRRLKGDSRSPGVPVLFVSSAADTGARLASFAAGAVDYISKPFEPDEIRARVKVHLELQQLRRALESKGRLHRSAEAQLEQAVAQAVLVVDAAGQIIFCTQSARGLLTHRLPRFDPATTSLPGIVRDEPFPHVPGRPKLHARRLNGSAAFDHDNGLTVFLLEEDAPDPSQVLLSALKLTRCEAKVLYWVREGKTSPEIAIILGAALTTVKKHLEHVYEKLGVETRTAAALLASEVLQRRDAL